MTTVPQVLKSTPSKYTSTHPGVHNHSENAPFPWTCLEIVWTVSWIVACTYPRHILARHVTHNVKRGLQQIIFTDRKYYHQNTCVKNKSRSILIDPKSSARHNPYVYPSTHNKASRQGSNENGKWGSHDEWRPTSRNHEWENASGKKILHLSVQTDKNRPCRQLTGSVPRRTLVSHNTTVQTNDFSMILKYCFDNVFTSVFQFGTIYVQIVLWLQDWHVLFRLHRHVLIVDVARQSNICFLCVDLASHVKPLTCCGDTMHHTFLKVHIEQWKTVNASILHFMLLSSPPATLAICIGPSWQMAIDHGRNAHG